MSRLDLDQLSGDRFSGAGVLRRLAGVSGLLGVGGHDQRLARIGVQLLQLGHLAVQTDLGLLLAGDDVGGLLLQTLVL